MDLFGDKARGLQKRSLRWALRRIGPHLLPGIFVAGEPIEMKAGTKDGFSASRAMSEIRGNDKIISRVERDRMAFHINDARSLRDEHQLVIMEKA